VLHNIYPTSLRVIINKRYKVVITSNRCRLGRSPNICVNIVKNPLGAMNSGVDFHLSLLSDDAMRTNFNLQVLAPCNKPYFVRACKDFSPVYLSFIYHSRVQSLYELIEVSTCPVTVVPFKQYKLLSQVPFIKTIEPISI